MRRRPLGALFAVLAVGFLLLGAYAADAGGVAWVIAAAAVFIGVWMGELAYKVAASRKTPDISRKPFFLLSSATMVERQDDTQALWREYKRTGEQAARDRLILTYAPLVKYVAGRLGSGLPAHVDEGDLVSYGLLGLIGAIERFDPDRDIKFETYAIARIKGSIIDELRSMDWVPRSVRARARDIERTIAQLEAKLTRAPTDEEIADSLGITEAGVPGLPARDLADVDRARSTSSGRAPRTAATPWRSSTRSPTRRPPSRRTPWRTPSCARRSARRSRGCPSARSSW